MKQNERNPSQTLSGLRRAFTRSRPNLPPWPAYGSWSGRRLAAWLLTLSCLLLPFAPATAEEQLIEVASGGQTVLRLEKPVRRVAVGSSQIAEAKVLGDKEILLQGNKPGATSLLLWSRGENSPASYRLQVNRASLTPASHRSGGAQATSVGDLPMVEGISENIESHEQMRAIARNAAGADSKGPLLDAATMSYGGEVQIDVKVVEFSRKVMKKAGLNFISNRSGFTFGTFAPASLTKVEMLGGAINTEATVPIKDAMTLVAGDASIGVLGVIGLLEGNGFARTLAQPVLVAQSGQTADFLAGGEFPVPVPQALGQISIKYKPFGIRLEVSPTVLAENRIALRVAPEVSELNFENAITISGVSVPSLLTRRANTSIELGNGESFVIGGLVSQSMMKSLNKIPFLGDIPVLGMFFKDASLSREDKELLFIVTPRLVRPLAANADIGPLPGADKANYNPSLWKMLLLSDDDEVSGYSGLSR